MTDLLQVLPDFDLKPFSHIVPSLEKACITSADLLTLEPVDVAKRAQVPPGEVRRLADELLRQLHEHFGAQEEGTDEKLAAQIEERKWAVVSTLDDGLDAALGGGFPAGYLSEITGESAAGKTQLLLTLLLAVQLPPPHGLSKSALYISTEAPLQTTRLNQILQSHPLLSRLEDSEKPSLARIQSTHIHDLEAQEHILRYQVPIAVQRGNIGLVILDSVAANFRAEFESGKGKSGGAASFAKRSAQLVQLGALLRDLASREKVAVVVANQVLDRFEPAAAAFDYASQHLSQRHQHNLNDNSPSGSGRSTPLPGYERSDAAEQQYHLSTPDPLALDHQQRFFTGWGDARYTRNQKTPSLGLTWTNQIAARVALLKEPVYKMQDYVLGPEKEIVGWTRTMKVAFSAWAADHNGREGMRFEIVEGGVRAVGDDGDGGEDERAGRA